MKMFRAVKGVKMIYNGQEEKDILSAKAGMRFSDAIGWEPFTDYGCLKEVWDDMSPEEWNELHCLIKDVEGLDIIFKEIGDYPASNDFDSEFATDGACAGEVPVTILRWKIPILAYLTALAIQRAAEVPEPATLEMATLTEKSLPKEEGLPSRPRPDVPPLRGINDVPPEAWGKQPEGCAVQVIDPALFDQIAFSPLK